MEYLGLIYRNDLNIMYVKGYMKINLERIVRVDGVEGNQICELLKLVSPFQYTSEYLFIVFESLKPIRAKKGVESVDYVDVRAVIPLDKVAMEELKTSFNHNIRLVEPRWASEVEDFSQELFMENMRRGAICSLQMLNKLNKRILIDVFLEKWTNDENLIVRFVNFQYRKEKLDDGNSTIWQYLLMYERHEPYPDTCLGYFFDSVHEFANWHYKKVCLTMPDSGVLRVLNRLELFGADEWKGVISELEKDNNAQKYVQECIHQKSKLRQYIVMPIYFCLLDYFSRKKEWKGIPNELLFLEKKYKNEYKIAACLVGLRLGFDSIHELYYDYVKKNSEYKSNENLISEI